MKPYAVVIQIICLAIFVLGGALLFFTRAEARSSAPPVESHAALPPSGVHGAAPQLVSRSQGMRADLERFRQPGPGGAFAKAKSAHAPQEGDIGEPRAKPTAKPAAKPKAAAAEEELDAGAGADGTGEWVDTDGDGIPDMGKKLKAELDAIPEGIDTAKIGQKGGVPFHDKGIYRSPFANPDNARRAIVRVGFLLTAVNNYDIKLGTFEADFFLSLTSEFPIREIEPSFPNGTAERTVLANKPTFKLYRYHGTFSSPPDLRLYPFDEQELRIEIEEEIDGVDQLTLVPDQTRTWLDVGFGVVGWESSYIEARVLTHFYPDRFDEDDLYYGRYVFTLGIARYSTSAVFTVYVPALVIVLISLLGMWVPPDEMEVRSNAGAPMLAAAVLFHFALMQELPATGYLTRADKLMIGVYVCLMLGMISTWWFFLVDEKRWDVVFRVARMLVPVLSAVIMALAIFV